MFDDNDSILHSCTALACILLKVFLLIVASICVWNVGTLFLQLHGVSHRLAGSVHFSLLLVGAWTANGATAAAISKYGYPHELSFFWFYDLLLGCSGIMLTLTAARDFPHKYVSNPKEGDCVQSGTLHHKAIVTQEEMVEHAFYQFMNLWQAMYLHTQKWYSVNYPEQSTTTGMAIKLSLLWLVTAPWLVRERVPVHSFSHNWKLYQKQQEQKRTTNVSKKQQSPTLQHTPEVFMYRIKKTQYIFYKHCILHGINLTVVLFQETALMDIPCSFQWRTFWILLNTSYVMEFFLQSLVKRRVLQQSTMLLLNQLLMATASLAAMVVLKHVPWWMVAISIGLNFRHRHHDVVNTLGIATAVLAERLMNDKGLELWSLT